MKIFPIKSQFYQARIIQTWVHVLKANDCLNAKGGILLVGE